MGNYRELEVWQKSRQRATHVYRATIALLQNEWRGLTEQMRRAAISIPSNVAEGHGRWTSRERINFLLIARGSTYELETQAFIASDLELLTKEQATEIVRAANHVAKILNGLIRRYRQNATPSEKSTANCQPSSANRSP